MWLLLFWSRLNLRLGFWFAQIIVFFSKTQISIRYIILYLYIWSFLMCPSVCAIGQWTHSLYWLLYHCCNTALQCILLHAEGTFLQREMFKAAHSKMSIGSELKYVGVTTDDQTWNLSKNLHRQKISGEISTQKSINYDKSPISTKHRKIRV